MRSWILKISHFIGGHTWEDYHPYPNTYPECSIKKCKICGSYEWR